MNGDFEYDTLRKGHYGKFKIIGDFPQKDVCAVEIIEKKDCLTTKIMFYSIQGTITTILNTEHSKKLSDELVTLIQARVKEIHYEECADFRYLMDYALGYTRNRFKEKVNQVMMQIRDNRTLFYLSALAICAIIIYFIKPEYGTHIVVMATILGAIVAAYPVLKGREKKSSARASEPKKAKYHE
jgi:hypothetical protein